MKHRTIAAAALLALVAAACGGEDQDAQPGAEEGTVVEIEMVDVAFEPDTIEVKKGEETTFRFVNSGEAVHEAYIGDAAAQEEHAAAMEEHGEHGDDEVLEVEPGDTGELTRTFDEDGEVIIGCHQPGHYEEGMKVTVTVS